MTFQVTFTVYGPPQGKARPRFTKLGKTYTPAKTMVYESEIMQMAKAAMGSAQPLETPVSVFIYIQVGVPQSFSKKRTTACLTGSERPCKKPDLDNVAKAFLDGMNKVVYKDDAQVVNLHVKKLYGAIPSVNVLVREEIE